MIDTMVSLAGMSEGTIGEDAEWLEMKHPRTGEVLGRILLTIEVVPKYISEGSHKNGMGREVPNLHPYLPEPTGRMHFSLNPFYIFYECCGPRIFIQAMLCCLLALVAVGYVFLKSSRIIE